MARSMAKNDKDELVLRLNRIKGQVEGILRMVDRLRPETEIFNQITAAKKALDSTGRHVLEQYISKNLSSVPRSKEERASIRQILEIMEKI